MIPDPGAGQAVPCLPLDFWFPNSCLVVPVSCQAAVCDL